MLTLAFASAAKSASVALVRDGALVASYTQCSGLTHSRTLLPMAEDLLKNTETRLQDIDLLAVSHGPGSFTGIRIGVSTVKGLSWALDKPCVGVSTLEGLAWQGLAAGGLICPVMDARRQQVYNAVFAILDGKLQRLTIDRAIALEDLIDELRQLEGEPFLVGDGAELAARTFDKAGLPYRLAPEDLRQQNAWGVAMAARDKTPGSSQDLLPVYLRLSQAERERQERLARESAAADN